MNHRKFSHPSNKKCRNFPGTCKFGERCWYVHENLEEKQDVSSVKCTLCVYTFADRKCLNEHMNLVHKQASNIGSLEKNPQVFQQSSMNTVPPDQINKMFVMLQTLSNKMKKMEERFDDFLM